MSFFTDFLFGRSPSREQVPTMTPQQMQLLNQLIGGLGGQGGAFGGFGVDEDFFQKSFVDPALKQFETRTAPAIQQKFIAAGAGQGSNLEDVLARAGADVQGQLNQQLAGLLENAQERQLRGAGLALGASPFTTVQDPGSTGALDEILRGFGGGAGGAVGRAAGKRFGFI